MGTIRGFDVLGRCVDASSVCTLDELKTEVECFLGEKVDFSGLSGCEYTVMPTVCELKTTRETYAPATGPWSFCSGAVVLSFPRVLTTYMNASRPRPLRPQDALYIHGQSALYISRMDDGALHAVYSA